MKKNHILIISGLFLLYGITNYIWLSKNTLPVSYDEGIHLWTSLRFLKAMTHPVHNMFYDLLRANVTHWPPLFHFTASLVNMVFGFSYVASVMTNMLFFPLLLFSLYFIAKKLYNEDVGIISIVIVSLYPIIYGHSRLFHLDFALTSIVTFGVYSLLKTEGFRDRKWSVVFGITAGLGMLIKWSFGFFILPLFIYVITKGLLFDHKKHRFLYQLKNLFIPMAIPCVLVLTWCIANKEKFLYITRVFLFRMSMGHELNFLKHIEWFMLNFNNNMLSFAFFFLFIICLAFFYARKTKFSLFCTIWYIAPLILLFFMKGKQSRLFMPILPCFALISAVGIDLIADKRHKIITLFLVCMIGLAQYFHTSFGVLGDIEPKPAGYEIREFSFLPDVYLENPYTAISAGPPHREDWKHAEIAKSIAKHVGQEDGYPFVTGIIYDWSDTRLDILFGNRVMNYYLLKELLKYNGGFSTNLSQSLSNTDSETGQFMDSLSDMRCLIYISRTKVWPTLKQIRKSFLNKPFSWREVKKDPDRYRHFTELLDNKENFDCVDRIPLPKGYYANIYFYRIPEIRKDDIRVKILNGRVKIYYKDKEITKGPGISFKFTRDNRTYGYNNIVSSYAESETRAVAVFKPERIGITQTVSVRLDPDRKNTVNIEAEIESVTDVMLDGWYANNLISDQYKEWMRPFSRGIFGEINMFRDSHDEPLDPDYDGPPVVGIRGNAKEGLPALLFRCFQADTPVQVGLSNTNYKENARNIYATALIPIRLEAGKPLIVLDIDISMLGDQDPGKITLDNARLSDGTHRDVYLFPEDIPEIRKDDIRVKILNGRVKIYYKDKEITKGPGISFKFTRDNRTYGYNNIVSSYAESETRAVAVFKPERIGITQTVSVRLDPDRKNTVNIEADLESKDDMILDGWFINNLISDQYKRWIRPFSKGEFKEISKTSDPYNYEPLDPDYDGPPVVGIRGNAKEGLPALLFRSCSPDIPAHAGVSNTTYNENARCVYIADDADPPVYLSQGGRLKAVDMSISILDDLEMENIVSGIEKGIF